MDTVVTPTGIYVEAGTWHGEVFTAVRPRAAFVTFAAKPPGTEPPEAFCISGTLPPFPDVQGFALLGVNLQQDQASGSAPGTIVPTGEGLALELVGAIGAMRAQLRGAGGITDDQPTWCARIPAKSVVIPYSDFRPCGDPTGNPYAREPISAVGLVAYEDTPQPTGFDVCLVDFGDGVASRP